MPWYYDDYSSYWDWNYWHDLTDKHKKIKSEFKRNEWNKKVKLPKVTRIRKGCWL